ncbi:hypothetical protein FHU41_000505 [Psychromicrobium silvestre]|uniref:Uncharacterized protein n=1 Tax=Psychromicrobium silvestre TaxID=1645614 RepID=A0A7Y9LRJ4_9MICC|nr:hypothetical protein [Psychromicrobium silvestre]NYE94284.1 hypothetical protein [Psychromicrobium silvestre]
MSSSPQDRFFVYFRRGAASLESALNTLPMHDLQAASVTEENFLVSEQGLSFLITLEESEQVPLAAAQAAGAEPRWQPLTECTARFAVEISDLEAALEEINTMLELQGALQDCCNGYLVLPWNGGILEPWGVD